MKEETRHDETGTRDKIREKAAGLASSAKEKVEAQYEQRVESALGEVSGIANALRQAGQQLREQNSSALGATVMTTVADRLDSIRNTIDGKDLGEVAANVERFARRNPTVFLSTAAALGFLAVRFLKSSNRSHETGLMPFDTDFDAPFRGMPRGGDFAGGRGSGSGAL